MRGIPASYDIINIPTREKALQDIERAARTCYKSEEYIGEGSAERLVKSLIDRGHEAMLEHVSFTVRFICDRGVSHELVRHRVASFAQESTRYCNYSKDKFGNELTFIQPCFWDEDSEMFNDWKKVISYAEFKYLNLIKVGATPQEARSVLPNSIKTEVVMTANLREWRHFFKLRTAKAAHPQMRELTIPLLEDLKDILPDFFNDIEVE